MRTVLFIVNDLNSGGIENYLLRFLQHYDGKILPTVLCKSGTTGVLESVYSKITNIQIIPLRVGFIDFGGFNSFLKFLRSNHFDTVVDFTGNFAGLTMLGAYHRGVKKRITFYRGSTNHFKEDFIRLTYNYLISRLVLKYSTDILSNSHAALKFFFKNRSDGRFDVIYNGIDASRFLDCNEDLRNELGIPDDAFVIGHVGRFAREKNHTAVFEVAKELCAKYKDLYFILCGKGVEEAFAEQIKRLKLERQIRVLGYRNDVVKVLNSLDAFYFPSISEGQPNALIEALIAGLPIVASNIESILETIPESHHKFLVSPEDTETAVVLLESLYKNRNTESQVSLKDWAIKNYDPVILFKKFYDKI
ncbi:glycosyltransferase [Sphingobacterium hotanense]|uniref:Glycosyltransferase n=1 Tax=Sphingobacterium hotanense TaxID=649196 RepID=A0ABT7NL51_9SPHI|nr:glycosyltransferase [Sphingobacterium hotanense]MDM1047939.1 glycosyltransferase [Sphingobacterium hotanense]